MGAGGSHNKAGTGCFYRNVIFAVQHNSQVVMVKSQLCSQLTITVAKLLKCCTTSQKLCRDILRTQSYMAYDWRDEQTGEPIDWKHYFVVGKSVTKL